MPSVRAAEKLGYKLICEAFYNGLEVADTSVDADIFTGIHRAHIKAVDKINQDIRPWLTYLTDEVPPDIGRLTPPDLHLPRLRYSYPEPYSPPSSSAHTANIMKRVLRCHDFGSWREASRSEYREYSQGERQSHGPKFGPAQRVAATTHTCFIMLGNS